MLLNLYILSVLFFWMAFVCLIFDMLSQMKKRQHEIIHTEKDTLALISATFKLFICSAIPGLNILMGLTYLYSNEVRITTYKTLTGKEYEN